ncbi:hypothetical protein F7725_024928 [Dissostichus mawsoni]|uniref:Raftlin n=1 Tax=Dissostichus mawsoni TaxID=36200 RepID=A0A7J5X9N7_DISMA|nr:hypothetical protein F7725_024928 [Dissostichus mawsoni]
MKLSNGYVLPEGKLTPNALFVGGIDMKVRSSAASSVHITWMKRNCENYLEDMVLLRKYGFVYFNEDVNIQTIIEQPISYGGRKLKLGPAIMKERSARSMPPSPVGPAPWMSPPQYFCCSCCSPMGGGMPQPSPIVSGGSPYDVLLPQLWRVMIPQMPINYAQNPYAYQSGGATGLPRGLCSACDHPTAPPTYTPVRRLDMGCRLPKLRKAEERRSPGNIYSTLRRPQVETKVGVAYTYHFLDFLLGKEEVPVSSVLCLSSVRELPVQVRELYAQGFVLVAVHPFVHPCGPRNAHIQRQLHRAVLVRETPSSEKSQLRWSRQRLETDVCVASHQAADPEVIQSYVKRRDMNNQSDHKLPERVRDKKPGAAPGRQSDRLIQDVAEQGVMFVGFLQQPGGGPSYSGNWDPEDLSSLHSSPSPIHRHPFSAKNSPTDPTEPHHNEPGLDHEGVENHTQDDETRDVIPLKPIQSLELDQEEASGQIFNESLESRNQHLSGVDTVLKRSNQNPAEAQVKPLCPSPPEAAGIIRQQRGHLPDLQESTEKHLDLSNQTDRQSSSSCSWPSSPELDRGTERKSSCTEGQSRATTHNNNHIRIKGSEKDENAATPQRRVELNTSLRFYSLRVPLQVQKEAGLITDVDTNWLDHMTQHFTSGAHLIDGFFQLEDNNDNGVSSVDSVFIFQSSAEDATHTSYDAIVVEQSCGEDRLHPLLQSLAPYGWRLIDGSLSTKQILFLQRPVLQRKRKDFKGSQQGEEEIYRGNGRERENMSPLMETEMDRLRRNSKEEEEEEEEGRKSRGSVRSEGGKEREEDTHHQRGFWFLSGSRASVEEQEEETDVDEIKLSELEESVRWTDVCRRSDGGVKEEGKTEERIKQQLFSGQPAAERPGGGKLEAEAPGCEGPEPGDSHLYLGSHKRTEFS